MSSMFAFPSRAHPASNALTKPERGFFQLPAAHDGYAGEPGFPALDTHLLMNTLNRMAALIYAEKGSEDHQLFLLSDYLRLSVTHMSGRLIRVAQEVAVLDSYVKLAGQVRGWDIQTDMAVRFTACDKTIQAQTTCMIARCLLRAYAEETQGWWKMAVEIDYLESQEFHIRMHLDSLPSAKVGDLETVHLEMQRLMDSLGAQAQGWRYELVHSPSGGVELAVNFRESTP